jgi:hypothetical protein
LESGLRVEATLVAGFFAAGFAFACAIGFDLCAAAFFPVAGFAFGVGFLAAAFLVVGFLAVVFLVFMVSTSLKLILGCCLLAKPTGSFPLDCHYTLFCLLR